MYKTTMKYLLLTAIFSTQLSLNSFAMDKESIENELKSIRHCTHPTAQRIYCGVVNKYGEKLLCDNHDSARINNPK